MQAPIAKIGEASFVPFDVAQWSKEFMKHSDRFVCFMNSKELNDKPGSYYPIHTEAELVDLGPLQSHYKRIFGVGFDRKKVYELSAGLDAVIIQGPTSLLEPFANALHPNCTPVFLLVGLLVKSPKTQFKAQSTFRKLLINLFIKQNYFSTKRAMRKGLFLGNNPKMESFYGGKNTFHLVSKGLVSEREISKRNIYDLHSPVNLLFYSRLDPDKHVETLINACEQLKNRGIHFQLDLAGAAEVISYKNYLLQLIEEKDLKSHIRLVGHIQFDKKQEVFKQSDIYIFNTCSTEGFPRTIWEAFSFGVPTVCANYPGASEFFKDGHDILLFPRLDYHRLADRIQHLIEDEDSRKRLIKQQYELLEQHTMEKSVAHICNLIQDFH